MMGSACFALSVIVVVAVHCAFAYNTGIEHGTRQERKRWVDTLALPQTERDDRQQSLADCGAGVDHDEVGA